MKECYLLWHSFLPHLPRLSRYTLGVKIDDLFTKILELTLTAQYTKREEKIVFLQQLSRQFDTLKFFITLLWEARALDENKFSQITRNLSSIGIKIGGWIRTIQTPQK